MLKKGVVPCIFPNIPAHLSKSQSPRATRKAPKVRSLASVEVSACQNETGAEDECDVMENAEHIEVAAHPCMLEDVLWLSVLQSTPTFEAWCVRASAEKVMIYKLEDCKGVVLV